MSNVELDARLQELENKLQEIALRNQRVEVEKAWEVSATRKLSIMLITYLLVVIVFFLASVPDFLFNALIPTLGFYLSTLSLPFVKHFWIKRCY